MTEKEKFNADMDELADAINDKAQTFGKKTVTEMTETVKNIPTDVTTGMRTFEFIPDFESETYSQKIIDDATGEEIAWKDFKELFKNEPLIGIHFDKIRVSYNSQMPLPLTFSTNNYLMLTPTPTLGVFTGQVNINYIDDSVPTLGWMAAGLVLDEQEY